MSLVHAILTSLNERPASGLELARRFDRSIGYFWPATHQQIYRELKGLERDGLIAQIADEGGRGGKRTYAILDEGRDELRRWMAGSEDPKHVKDALMVRVRASASLGGDLLPEIRRHREIHARQMAEYQAIEKKDFQGELSGPRRRQYLALQWGLHLQKARLDWADAAIEQLEALDDSSEALDDPNVDPKGTP